MTHDSTPKHDAHTSWFHVFRSMVDSGDVATMGSGPAALYLVVKSCLSWNSGKAFPSQETLAKKAGMSRRTVQRHLDTLAEYGYLHVECGKDDGVTNTYTLREKIVLHGHGTGEPEAVASWDYLPGSVKAAVQEVHRVALTGDFAGAKIIHIENLTINIQNFATGDYAAQFCTELEKIKDPGLRKQILSAYEKAMSRKAAEQQAT